MRKYTLKHVSHEAGVRYAFLALLLTTSLIFGSRSSAAQAGSASDAASPAQRDFRFEVISIRPGDPMGRLSGPPGPAYTPGRFRVESNTVIGLAFRAFRKKHPFELESSRMNTDHFTITATIPEGAGESDLPIMIQHLLEDRFGLKYHHETRPMAGYELVVAKSGSKLAKSAGPAPDGSTVKGPGFTFQNGEPQFGKDARSIDMCFGKGCALHGGNKTMQALASDLAEKLNGPVTDATGLEGGYDYTLIYTPEPRPSGGIVLGPAGGVLVTALPDGPLDHPLIRDALRETAWFRAEGGQECPGRCGGSG